MAEKFSHSIKLEGREELSLTLSIDDSGSVTESQLQGVGGPEFLDLLKMWRPKLQGALQDFSLPTGKSVGELMLKELILRAQAKWEYPYDEEELCHCRAVPLAVVDAAILVGAHTPVAVSRDTSASTACGTCRPDVEAILKCRLGS